MKLSPNFVAKGVLICRFSDHDYKQNSLKTFKYLQRIKHLRSCELKFVEIDPAIEISGSNDFSGKPEFYVPNKHSVQFMDVEKT